MPEAPNGSPLMEAIKSRNTVDEPTKKQQLSQIPSAKEMQVKDGWKALLPLLRHVEDSELREWISLAFLGVCVGFAQRNLLPSHPEHQYLYPQIIEEMSKTYEQLRQEGFQYDWDEVRFEIYDYGINCAYHLDWKLYLSKECY